MYTANVSEVPGIAGLYRYQMPEISSNTTFDDYLKEAFFKQFAKTSTNTDDSSQEINEAKEKQEYEKETADRGKLVDFQNLEPNMIYNIYDIMEAYVRYLNGERNVLVYGTYADYSVFGFSDLSEEPQRTYVDYPEGTIPIGKVSIEDFNIFSRDYNNPKKEYAALLREFSNVKSTADWAYVGLLECKRNFETAYSPEFQQMTEETDLTGLSDTEKYLTIMDKYEYCYGDDFLKSFSLGVPLPSQYLGKLGRLSDELTEQFGSREAAQKVARQAEYGNMTDGEIRAEIIDKYPPKGERTYRDIIYMSYEMNRAGVDYGLFGNGLLQDAAKSYGNKTAADYVKTLDKKVGNDYEAKVWKLFENRTKYTLPASIGAVISDIFA
jgi:hypothetical protein